MDEKNKMIVRKKIFTPPVVILLKFDDSVIVTSGNGFETGSESITPTEQTWEW